ncbi:hypothetical protein OG594_42870 [Streptomyces sp. NBC_01214]|uniref:hypothetical protein n=1 Tax=Streptomyces sp. NBC_01214 TaxID=2903777 RepID=UPI00225AD0BA|nr:hypothetical protein [Streptomyces sp. NBC_01214]MCX4808257.1 hypothetical protein [Streptomyces sp. NBC_01214]
MTNVPDFTNTFGGVPPHPSYMQFVEGVHAHVDGSDDPQRWRWQPFNAKWWRFQADDWTLDAISADTSNSHIEYVLREFPPGGKNGYNTWSPNLFFPSLFEAVTKVYLQIKDRYPYAIWNGNTGEWRDPKRRKLDDSGTGATLPQGVKDRIARVYEAERLGYITRDEAAKIIADIIAEVT